MTKGPRRHKETWWWNEEVAEAVSEKKIKYGRWKKENTKEASMDIIVPDPASRSSGACALLLCDW